MKLTLAPVFSSGARVFGHHSVNVITALSGRPLFDARLKEKDADPSNDYHCICFFDAMIASFGLIRRMILKIRYILFLAQTMLILFDENFCLIFGSGKRYTSLRICIPCPIEHVNWNWLFEAIYSFSAQVS